MRYLLSIEVQFFAWGKSLIAWVNSWKKRHKKIAGRWQTQEAFRFENIKIISWNINVDKGLLLYVLQYTGSVKYTKTISLGRCSTFSHEERGQHGSGDDPLGWPHVSWPLVTCMTLWKGSYWIPLINTWIHVMRNGYGYFFIMPNLIHHHHCYISRFAKLAYFCWVSKFVISQQIANSHILGLIPLSQICKYACSLIANHHSQLFRCAVR